MSKLFFAFLILLVISLSTGTAFACSPPTSIESPSDPFLCFGNGTAGDFPAGVSTNGEDANCSAGTYGVTCYTCYPSYYQDTGGVCRPYGYCSEASYADWAYYYDYFYYVYYDTYLASYYASLLSGCFP